jgi:hypothetical protein
MVAPNFETTMPSASTKEQHTPLKLADMASPAKPKLAERAQRLFRSCLHLTNDDSSKNGDVATLSIKVYDGDCSSHWVPAHPPLTLILPTTPNLAQYIACLPALARHAKSWLTHNDALEVDQVGEQLNELADMAVELQGKCAWPGQNLGQACAGPLQTVVGRVRTSIRELLEGEQLIKGEDVIPKLGVLAAEAARELGMLCMDLRWRGCRTCAGHVSSILIDVYVYSHRFRR